MSRYYAGIFINVLVLTLIANWNSASTASAGGPYNNDSSGWSDSDVSANNPESSDGTSPGGESSMTYYSPEDNLAADHDALGCNTEVLTCSNSPVIDHGSACDAQSSTCSDNPSSCDPQDQSCNQPTCNPTDTTCKGQGEPNCEVGEENCNGAPFSPSQVQCNNSNDGTGIVDVNLQCVNILGEVTIIPPDKNALGAIQETELAEIISINAERTLPREDICNDGKDDDSDGLKDLQDSDCSLVLYSELKSSPSLRYSDAKSYSNTTSNTSSNSPVQLKGSVILQPLMISNNINNVHTIIITAPANRDIRTVSSFDSGFSSQELKIKRGDKVVWINEDPSKPHGIVLVDKVSGKIVYQQPDIRYKGIASYEFKTYGEFTFYDTTYYSMTGKIIVQN